LNIVWHDRPVPEWSLRPATDSDREFLFDLHRVTMGAYIDATFGWDDREQQGLFDESFAPGMYEIIRVAGEDAGVLALETSEAEISLGLIEIQPRFQGRGIGTSVIESVLQRAAETNKPVALRVLRVNRSARSLYERLGFVAYREDDARAYLRADPSLDNGGTSPTARPRPPVAPRTFTGRKRK
jgi:GNAT superfamily N-acetyltransferase